MGNPKLWVYPKGGRLSGKTRVKEVSFQMFPEGSDRGIISYLKG